jgi:aerobic-type carbon monoxide dehydrogenase small subunit (CoxS/CutS family)
VTRSISLRVNGTVHDLEVEPRLILADLLRGPLGLTGTHLGCEHGVCGSCTILLDGEAARSCLVLAVQADEAEVLTVEGLGTPEQLHPLQLAFSEARGLQCGFCTPGMLITAYAFLQQQPAPTREQAREAVSGNLCRCTGYAGIVEAIVTAGRE